MSKGKTISGMCDDIIMGMITWSSCNNRVGKEFMKKLYNRGYKIVKIGGEK